MIKYKFSEEKDFGKAKAKKSLLAYLKNVKSEQEKVGSESNPEKLIDVLAKECIKELK